MALVLPVLIFVLYGLITFGVILAQKQQITNAAADGARAAVGQTSGLLAQAAAKARVEQSLGPQGKYTATITTATCSGGSGQCVTVNVVYNYAAYPIVPTAPGLGLITPSTFTSKAIVQYSL